MEVITKSSRETQDFGKNLAASLTGGETLALVGDLGAGKTTFTQGLVEGLHSKDRVSSPTFILMREYEGDKKIYHIDLYRLEGEGEMIWKQVRALGVEDFWERKDTIIIIEWAEKIIDHLPGDTIWVEFENMGEDERRLKVRQ